jgi:hypothetical protein
MIYYPLHKTGLTHTNNNPTDIQNKKRQCRNTDALIMILDNRLITFQV